MNTVEVSPKVVDGLKETPTADQKKIQAAVEFLHKESPEQVVKKPQLPIKAWRIRIDKDYHLDYVKEGDKVQITNLGKRSDRKKESANALVMSYMDLRKAIGFFGMLLPFILAINPQRTTDLYLNLEPSISDYYYTNRGDFLVVLLCILGAFLFTYIGYTFMESLLTRIAAVGAFGVAFFPTKPLCDDCFSSIHTTNGGVFGNWGGAGIHLFFAAMFFVCLAWISIKYFPQTDASSATMTNNKTTQKSKRNRVFKTCGYIMFGCVAILFVYVYFLPKSHNWPIIFIFETIAIEAFGLSWLTKGEMLWPDSHKYKIEALSY